jgi:hypothetical protein
LRSGECAVVAVLPLLQIDLGDGPPAKAGPSHDLRPAPEVMTSTSDLLARRLLTRAC